VGRMLWGTERPRPTFSGHPADSIIMILIGLSQVWIHRTGNLGMNSAWNSPLLINLEISYAYL
jgi:hypothetical protein